MYYFVSDIHLGLDAATTSAERERRFISWLDVVSSDAKAIFLAGDIFDFWFEFKRVVPKGFTRLLARIASLTESGTQVHLICGNHDYWCGDYLTKECGIIIHKKAVEVELYGKRLYIDHGHQVPRGSLIVSAMNFVFSSGLVKAVASAVLHPNFILGLGQGWSSSSRKAKPLTSTFAQEKEPITVFARKKLETEHIDYFVFGHLHCLADYALNDTSRLIILGEWIEHSSYARLSEDGVMSLLDFEK
ncbi:MAG: UDP-2,3-diacylglucosamine diphosphatase [Rikenellaceae bacterium]